MRVIKGKPWYESKTILTNILSALVLALIWTLKDFNPELAELVREYAPVILMSVCGINVGFRLEKHSGPITKQKSKWVVND